MNSTTNNYPYSLGLWCIPVLVVHIPLTPNPHLSLFEAAIIITVLILNDIYSC